MKKNKAFNKILAVILVIISIFSMVSCSKDKQEGSRPSSSEQDPIKSEFKQIKSIGPNEEAIRQIVSSHDGLSFFIMSENWLCEYDMYTTELKSQVNLTEAIKQKLVQKGDVAIQNSFLHRFTPLTGDAGEFYVVADSIGNMFKLKKNVQGKLEVCDDYCLIEYEDKVDEEGEIVQTYTSKEIVGLDVIQYTNQMFVLIREHNIFYVEEYDIGDLSKGVIKRKMLWEFGYKETEYGYRRITPLKNTGVLGFYAHGDQLILIEVGGSVIRMSKDLVDTTYSGGMNFYEDAKNYYENEDCIRIYNEAYVLEIAEQLKDRAANKEAPENLASKQAEIDALAAGYIEQGFDRKVDLDDLVEFTAIYTAYSASSTTIKMEMTVAKKAGEEAAENYAEAAAGWCKDYDARTMELCASEEYFDYSCYASFMPGESVIGGMVYVKQNDALYYTNLSDGYLYTVDVDKLKTACLGNTISELSTKVENIHCKAGQTFNTFGNGLCYNSFANTLYIRFDNKSDVQIVDLNDKNNYQVIGEYKGVSDMVYFLGDKGNTVMHVLHLVSEMKHDVEYRYLYVSTFNLKQ